MIKNYLSLSSKTILISIISLIMSFLLLKLQLRFLGLEQRGLLILDQANIAVLTSLIRFGVGQSVIKALVDYDKHVVGSNFIVIVLVQSVFICIVLLLLCLNTNIFKTNVDFLSLLTIISYGFSGFLFSSLSTFSFLSNSTQAYLIQTLMVGALNIGFLLVVSNFSTVGINQVFICITAAQFFVILYLIKLLPGFSFKYIKKEVLANLIINGSRSIGWSFIKDLSYKIDLLIFGNLLSKHDFGIYSVMQNLSQSLWRITDQGMAAYSKYLMKIKNQDYVKFTNVLFVYLCFFIVISLGIGFFTVIPVFEFLSGVNLSKYFISTLLFLFAILVFNIWKLFANFFIQIGDSIPMYKSLVLLIVLFFAFQKLAITLNHAVFITALVYFIVSISMIFFYKQTIRSKSFLKFKLN